MQYLIFGIACIIYINTLPNKWALDDSIVVHGNRYVKRGIWGLDSIFTKGTFYGFYGADVNAVVGDRYRPLSPALFAISAELFASSQKDAQQNNLKDKAGFTVQDLSATTSFPQVLHFFNILCYGLLCMLLYRLILFLLNPNLDLTNAGSLNIAAISSLLFTVHPLHTEAVANVKGLDEILSLLLALSATFYLVKAWRKAQVSHTTPYKYWILGTLAFFLGLLAKESTITFLAIIPLCLWFFTTASLKRIAVLCLPLLLVFGVYWGLRYQAVGGLNTATIKSNQLLNDPFIVLNEEAKFSPLVPGASLMKLNNPAANTFVKLPYSNQLATNIYTYGLYLKLLVWPYPLTYDYYPRHIAIKSFADPMVLLALLLNASLLVWAIWHTKKRHPIAFGILFYFISFSIVSNLIFPIGTNMAERFMFSPLVGYCFCIAVLANKLIEKGQAQSVFIVLTLLSSVYAFICLVRNLDWKDDYTLMSHDIKVSVNSGKVKLDIIGIGLNKALNDEAQAEAKLSNLPLEAKQEAIKAIHKTRDSLITSVLPYGKEGLAISPMYGVGWLQVAKAYHVLSGGESININQQFTYLNTAMEAYKQALYYHPINSDKEINSYLSKCYTDLGKFYGQNLGDTDKAISLLEEAIKLDDTNSEPYFLLGTAYSMKQNYQLCITYTQRALAANPEDYKIKENLAVAYQQYYIADVTQKALLTQAELLLINVLEKEQALPDDELTKRSALLRTLDLLQKNYALQGNSTKQAFYKAEALTLEVK